MLVRKKRIEIKKGIIGVISDTHGLVRPEALAALKGSELIIHGGDIGKPEVLQSLMFHRASVCHPRQQRPRCLGEETSGHSRSPDQWYQITLIHNVNELEIDLNAAGIRAVISGHSHKPSIVQRDDVLFLNPGSAGPRRFKLPVTIARLDIQRERLRSVIVELL